jgi:hypothetical protein
MLLDQRILPAKSKLLDADVASLAKPVYEQATHSAASSTLAVFLVRPFCLAVFLSSQIDLGTSRHASSWPRSRRDGGGGRSQ